MGTGDEWETERYGERTGRARKTGNGQGTAKGESDRGEEANIGGKKKGNRWWGAFKSTRGSTKEEVLIKFSTYNIRSGRNGCLE